MKIICIGRNYSEHAKELGNEVPSAPVVFMKPSTALTVDNKPFFHPDFSTNVHFEAELVYRISRNGKSIERKFAHRYYQQVALGIDFTARDLQENLKKKGLPWEKAKAFDGSAVVSEFVDLASLPNPKNINFSLYKNEKLVQQGDSAQMLFDIDAIIEYVSRYFKLLIGDLIFTGTPAGVGKVEIGDHFTGSIESRQLLDTRVK